MDILIRQARLSDGENLQDIGIKDGKIVVISDNLTENAVNVIEADGRVLIPGLVESHIHLDKALIADRKPNKSGTLQEAISVTAELKPTFTEADIYERAKKALEMIISHGVTAVRTHAEFDPAQGFQDLKQFLKLKEEYKDLIDMQIVAFHKKVFLKRLAPKK